MKKSDLYRSIIVEGMDNTGKTTLIAKLKSALPKCYVVTSSPGPNETNMGRWIMEQGGNVNPCIYDRHPIVSEEIYGRRIRGYSKIRNSFSGLLRYLLAEQQPIFIYCNIPASKIISNFGDRPQMEGVEKNIKDLCLAYDSYFTILGGFIDCIHYNWETDPDASRLLDKLSIHTHPLDTDYDIKGEDHEYN